MTGKDSSRPVCVLGLGLIGGSVVRAAARAGLRVWGWADSQADRAAAAAAGHPVEPGPQAALDRAAAEDALVVLAVPLPAMERVVAQVAQRAPTARLTDVAGVAEPVARTVARHAPRARYVGGHPMAGTASAGWAASSAELFDGAAWVLDTAAGDHEVWLDVARLALACGAHVVPAERGDHDAAVARVSHLPHLLAAVLAAVGADGGPLAVALGAGSFADGTRVAAAPPELVRAMCEGNRAALLEALDDALGRLGAARGSLASTGSLESTLSQGHRARQAFETARAADPGAAVRDVDLTSPTARDRLRELGRLGGRIVDLDGSIARVVL